MKPPSQPAPAPPADPSTPPASPGERVASGDPAWVCGPVTPATDALLAWVVWQLHERDGQQA